MQPHLRALFTTFLFGACTIGSNQSEPPPFAVDDAEHAIHYLRSGDFVDRTARVASAMPFLGVGIAAEMPDQSTLEFRLHGADGSTGPWQALIAEWSEGGYRTVVLELDAPTTAIELRSDLAPSFVRVELSATAELLGAHEGALDDAPTRAARPGIWQPPASTLAIGNTQSIPYVGATGCSSTSSLLPGTRDIADMLRASFPGATSYGGYNCRKIAGTNTWSVHATGRAIDLFVTPVGGQADNDGGDPIANWLIEHSEYVGVSFVIWDRASWGAHRPAGAKHKQYGGEHPHHDHLHIEVSQAAASRGTQWFADGKPRPGATSCRPKAFITCNGAELLQPGRVLARGEFVDSCDGRFFLTMQTDGNLVLYQRNVGALWSTLTYNSGADRAVMQTDGNLVVYRGASAVWASNTNAAGSVGAVQSDGNLVLYKNSTPTWATYTTARPTPDCATAWLRSGQRLNAGESRTSCDGRFTLVMQTDGNLVLYQRGAPAVWNSATYGTGATFAAMQEDGNLVLYKGSTAVWASATNRAGASLAIQSDGNLVIYGGGQALWNSTTAECP